MKADLYMNRKPALILFSCRKPREHGRTHSINSNQENTAGHTLSTLPTSLTVKDMRICVLNK
jgi:hypothetical protein